MVEIPKELLIAKILLGKEKEQAIDLGRQGQRKIMRALEMHETPLPSLA